MNERQRQNLLERLNDMAPLSAIAAEASNEITRLRHALQVIAGEIPPSDYSLGSIDIARIALHGRD